jgi:arsenical pump membrane protein
LLALWLHPLEESAATTLPLLAFLTAALWLAALAERAGLAHELAAVLARAARGSGVRLYGLTCALCALLTLTISLDGAVVLMAPLILALTTGAAWLRRPLLLGTVGVANAASLAVPQGNPANLVVMQRLGLGPAAFIGHLVLPALVATAVCVVLPALSGRAALRRPAGPPQPASTRSVLRPLAVGALGAATVAAAAGPWLGLAPWIALAAVAAASFALARIRGLTVPVPRVPWRIGALVAALVALVSALPGLGSLGAGGSLTTLLVAAGAAALLSAVLNNLPAGVALAGVLGGAGPAAYGVLAGLSVGALATPHGSVATLIAFERGGGAPRRAIRTIFPAAVAGTVLATTTLWLLG